jgi:amino acid transporter
MEIESTGAARRRLSLVDTISVIVGIVIGAGIYETPPLVFGVSGGLWTGLAVWAVGGLISLVGAFTYAELASTYPRSGGDYVYLTRAYGSWAGFLFGWAQLAVILTGSIGMMAYIFGNYAAQLFKTGEGSSFGYAIGAVVALSILNVFGISVGKVAQNVLSAVKVLGLLGIVAAAIYVVSSAGTPGSETSAAAQTTDGAAPAMLGLALVFVLYTYGGWNDAAFVVAELQESRRIVPALILGTLSVTAIYLIVNSAYLGALGFDGVRQSKAVAADVLDRAVGELGRQGISALVMISALGAANGLIYTGSRLYATFGADYSIFAALGRWHPRWGSPVYALAAQAAITLLMICAVGTAIGQDSLTQLFTWLGMDENRWKWEGKGGFDSLLALSAPVFWAFFMLTSLALIRLRSLDPATPRPFRAPLYPELPLVFTAACGFMLYSAIDYAGRLGLVGAALLAIGVPLYFLSPKTVSRTNARAL